MMPGMTGNAAGRGMTNRQRISEKLERCGQRWRQEVFAMIEDDLRARLAVPIEPSISEQR
jgi:hypothetical protein